LPGTRQNALFGLSIVAAKACMSPGMIRPYLIELVNFWKERDEEGIKYFELDRALGSGFNSRYLKTSSYRLEELFGWKFNRTTKRRVKGERVSREEVLKFARSVKTQLAKGKYEDKIKELVRAGYCKSVIAQKLGMSRQNLYKTYGVLIKKCG